MDTSAGTDTSTATATRKVSLYPKQKGFLSSPKNVRGFCGGIGSGKSWVGAYDLLRRAKPGRLYMVTAPTYTLMADASFRSVESLARQLGMLGDIARGKPPYIKHVNGAEILFRSTDEPDMLRGPNLSGVWMDEASLSKEVAFDILFGRLREGGELGWITATFTPKGKAHWTYKRLRDAPDTELFHATTNENPFLPHDFYESRKRQYSSHFAAQELEGAFLDDGGNYLMPGQWPRYTDLGDAFAIRLASGNREVIHKSVCVVLLGLDWAMGKKKKKIGSDHLLSDDGLKGDFTVFIVAALTPDGRLLILDVFNQRLPLDENAKHLERFYLQYRPSIIAGDDDMLSESMVLDCRRYRLPEIRRLPINGKHKRIRAESAIIRGENGRIFLPMPFGDYTYPWIDAFCDQLSMFTGIDDEHDDMVDGLGILGRLADDLQGDPRGIDEPYAEPAPNVFGQSYGWGA